jgi:hypothetical protein
MKPGLLLNRWAREGELPPSPAPHPQKQNLAVYTKELTHLTSQEGKHHNSDKDPT